MKRIFSFLRHFLRAEKRCLAKPTRILPPSHFRPQLESLEKRLTPAGHDTLATAMPVAFTLSQSQEIGALADPNEADLYALSLHAGDEIAADVSPGSAGSPAACLRVFIGSGQQVGFQANTKLMPTPMIIRCRCC